jgi:hypothetical protein
MAFRNELIYAAISSYATAQISRYQPFSFGPWVQKFCSWGVSGLAPKIGAIAALDSELPSKIGYLFIIEFCKSKQLLEADAV